MCFFLRKEPNCERFEKSDYFNRILLQFCYHLGFQKFSSFFPERASFLFRKRQHWNFLGNFTILVAFYSNFATFCNLINFKVFLKKPIFFIKLKLWALWEVLLFQSYCTTYLPILEILKNSRSFFRKPVLSKNWNAESFKKSYFFSCIVQQKWYL